MRMKSNTTREDTTRQTRNNTTTCATQSTPRFHTQTTHHTHHTRLMQVAPFCVGDFCCAFLLSTMVGVGNATRAAMRRRQRRLRAWARHERLSIAMALATVEHHSYGPTANRPKGPDDRHQCQRGRGPRAALRPTGTEATSPWDAASTAVGGAAAGGVAAAHRGAEDRAHALRADPRRSCAAEGGTAAGFLQGF